MSDGKYGKHEWPLYPCREIDPELKTSSQLQAEIAALREDNESLRDNCSELLTNHAKMGAERDEWKRRAGVFQEARDAWMSSSDTYCERLGLAMEALEKIQKGSEHFAGHDSECVCCWAESALSHLAEAK